MQDNSFLLEFCISVYRYHEIHSEPVLSAKQIAQLNLYFMSDRGSYSISFPVPDTMVIYNEENIIEYTHYPKPMVREKKQIVTILDKFNKADLQDKAVLVWKNGQYISTRDYYGMKVNLYTMPGFLVELFYNSYLNKIEKIEVVSDTQKLNKQHLDQIGINDLLNSF